MTNTMSVSEFLNRFENAESPIDLIFQTLLEHEVETAEFALEYELNRLRCENIQEGTNVIEDAAKALEVYQAFITLMDFYGVGRHNFNF